MKPLKFSKLRKAVRNTKYLIVTDYNNETFAINCKLQIIQAGDNFFRNGTSSIICFKPCDISEYISTKNRRIFQAQFELITNTRPIGLS